ncbi:hypothetical protein Tsubulata_021311 [Turnera subulata]|uniref:F-box domain-containing protein n=1 Tax=Turnera subulata TaxID=218843 RepID=A0A9Q0FR70_9ROSI|nr:hypothetical protein Tsubulata_021311 [Turnera subulata]
MNLDFLDEDCLSHILSFTSPRDATCVSLVSPVLRSSADSDKVWDKFLPHDYQDILSRLISPLEYSSKKDLFLRLCNPHFVDGGRKIFSIEKATGKKRYMLSARELSITWADHPLYWCWKPLSQSRLILSQSRFSEVVELRTICWLEIKAKINTKMLSPRTQYGAYLIMKLADRAYGLDTLPSEVSLEVGNFKSQGVAYLRRKVKHKQALKGVCILNRIDRIAAPRADEIQGSIPCREREDGWIEIKLGSFYNDGSDDKDVKMCLKEVTGEHLKGGLIVEGLELRPKPS